MLYDPDNLIRGFGVKRRLNVGTDARPIWIDNVHAGKDYAETYGNDPVRAIQPGTVTFSGWSNKYGWHVKARRKDGLRIGYHSLGVKSGLAYGDPVEIGDLIGVTGESASGANGNHVHIEADRGGDPFDPTPYIAGATLALDGATDFPNPDPAPAAAEKKEALLDMAGTMVRIGSGQNTGKVYWQDAPNEPLLELDTTQYYAYANQGYKYVDYDAQVMDQLKRRVGVYELEAPHGRKIRAEEGAPSQHNGFKVWLPG